MTDLSRPMAFLAALVFSFLSSLPGTALAVEPEDLPEGDFPPEVVAAAQDGVPIRAEAGYLHKKVSHLSKGQEVVVDHRQGQWLRVRPSGWVLIEHLVSSRASTASTASTAPTPSTWLVVTQPNARVRGGPGTDHPIERELAAGDVVAAVAREGDWWRLEGGGWLFHTLARETASDAGSSDAGSPGGGSPDAGSPDAGSPGGGSPGGGGASGGSAAPSPRPDSPSQSTLRRWSYMDLNGSIFEVAELDPRSGFVPTLKRAMDATGVLESDWTFMYVRIGVPPDSEFRFNYSQRTNTTVVVDAQGSRYGNVYIEGPVEKLPINIRQFFQPATVHAGEQYEGVLLFRPTLAVDRIGDVEMFLGGAQRRFYESP